MYSHFLKKSLKVNAFYVIFLFIIFRGNCEPVFHLFNTEMLLTLTANEVTENFLWWFHILAVLLMSFEETNNRTPENSIFQSIQQV